MKDGGAYFKERKFIHMKFQNPYTSHAEFLFLKSVLSPGLKKFQDRRYAFYHLPRRWIYKASRAHQKVQSCT